ncbi:hypothetical protein Dimus_034470 [Dionaea muscipula]
MAGSSSCLTKLACLLLICITVAAPSRVRVGAIVTCNLVVRDLSGCIGYLRSGDRRTLPACCGGVRALAGAARTTPDRRQACRCIKSFGGRFPNYGYAQSLPRVCRVYVGYSISPSTDCNTVR